MALSPETQPRQLKLQASPGSLRKQGTGSQLRGPQLLFLSVPALWAGSERYRPAGRSRGQAAPAPRAALLSPHGRALCRGAVSLETVVVVVGLLLVFPLQTIPTSGVGLSRSDVLGRYSSKLPSCLRHWSAPASEHLESSLWADLESRTKEGKQLLKAACFSELLSENNRCGVRGALQAP